MDKKSKERGAQFITFTYVAAFLAAGAALLYADIEKPELLAQFPYGEQKIPHMVAAVGALACLTCAVIGAHAALTGKVGPKKRA